MQLIRDLLIKILQDISFANGIFDEERERIMQIRMDSDNLQSKGGNKDDN